MRYGIDVSKHQGAIDWPQTAAALRQANGGQDPGFAILRAGYGNTPAQKDAQFEANYQGARGAGVPVGAYWYSYALGPEDAVQEARACLQVLAGRPLTYPVWYDLEYEPALLRQDNAGRTACCKAFCAELQRAGYKTGLYCSRDYLNNRLDSRELAGYDLWVAAYTGADSPGQVALPYAMWQYSSANPLGLPGFGAHLDCNICYVPYPDEGQGSQQPVSKEEGHMVFTRISGKRLRVTSGEKPACEIFSRPSVEAGAGRLAAGSVHPLLAQGDTVSLAGMEGTWYTLEHEGAAVYVLALPDRCRVEEAPVPDPAPSSPGLTVTLQGAGEEQAGLLCALARLWGLAVHTD